MLTRGVPRLGLQWRSLLPAKSRRCATPSAVSGCSSSACCCSTSTRCATASRRRCAGAPQASCQCCLPPRTSSSVCHHCGLRAGVKFNSYKGFSGFRFTLLLILCVVSSISRREITPFRRSAYRIPSFRSLASPILSYSASARPLSTPGYYGIRSRVDVSPACH